MTREEHIEKINEIIKRNRQIKSYIETQNKRLSQMRDYAPEDVKEAYQDGLNTAWEYARKIALNVEEGALRDVFNVDTSYSIFIRYSAQEAIQKIAEYEKQKDVIKVGDEVLGTYDDTMAVIMGETEEDHVWHVYTENGCVEKWHENVFRKTRRTFPQIEEVLKAMQEGAKS